MKITRQIIEHIAELAMLDLGEGEINRLTTEMERIIAYMDKLNEIDTSKVEPREHLIAKSNVFRDDEVRTSLDREKILQIAPASENGCFKVPRVME
jgi:aspartyl-tRNA(Asn)/glutamyl-tRNA(Gln) amidotransferase subunit C